MDRPARPDMLGLAGRKVHMSQTVGQSKYPMVGEDSRYFVDFLGKIGLPPIYNKNVRMGRGD